LQRRLLGPLGVSKTRLAIGLGVIKTVEAGYRVLFLNLEILISRLKKIQMEYRVTAWMPADEQGGSGLVFLSAYEKASLIITSNKSLVDWGEILGTKCWPRRYWADFCITQRCSA